MNIDLARAFRFAFADKRWLNKLGVLLLIGLVPGLNLIAWVGYQQSIARNVALGAASPLPAWDEWGDILVRGLTTIVAGFVYFSPLMLVGCCAVVFNLLGGRDAGALLLTVRCASLLVVLVYGAFALLLLSVGSVRYARTDQYGGYYQFAGRLRELLAGRGVYIPGFIVQIGLALAVALIGLIAVISVIGPFVVLTAFSVVNGHITGQMARQTN